MILFFLYSVCFGWRVEKRTAYFACFFRTSFYIVHFALPHHHSQMFDVISFKLIEKKKTSVLITSSGSIFGMNEIQWIHRKLGMIGMHRLVLKLDFDSVAIRIKANRLHR